MSIQEEMIRQAGALLVIELQATPLDVNAEVQIGKLLRLFDALTDLGASDKFSSTASDARRADMAIPSELELDEIAAQLRRADSDSESLGAAHAISITTESRTGLDGLVRLIAQATLWPGGTLRLEIGSTADLQHELSRLPGFLREAVQWLLPEQTAHALSPEQPRAIP